jgi:cell division initiation protein
MIDLTPLEVRKKKGDFRRAMRGYDPLLVDDFLDLVADRLEELVRENLALQESVGRQEQQVADYRDREKALTEALVSAQEMREEVRRQAAREAEESMQAARQEAAELRASVEQESRELREESRRDREAARRELEDARSAREEALKEIAGLRTEADALRAEADALRANADALRRPEEQEPGPAASTMAVGPEQADEQLRQLYARQQELISNYRAMLERELAELSTLAPGLTLTAAAAAPQEPEVQPHEAPADVLPHEAPADAQPTAEPEVAQDEVVEDELKESDVADEAAFTMGFTPGALLELEGEPFDPEPFEPEPFQPDEDELEAFEGDDVAEAYESERDPVEGSTDTTEVSGAGIEARLYDGIAADESGDGVPGPIGLGEPEVPAPWDAEPWTLAPAAPDDVFDLDDADLPDADEDDDPDTAALLRNAAAAGYRLSEDDIPDEPVIDEQTTGNDDEDADDDGWLPGLLDDDRE